MRSAFVAVIALGLLPGCAPELPPASPPATALPFATALTPDPTTPPPAAPAPTEVAPEPPPAPAPSADPPAPPKGPSAHVALEAPFRLDQRPIPSAREAFLVELRDRMRWNEGAMGDLAEPPPAVPGHPMPRVIVDVTRASGAHKSADVLRLLRRNLWMKVVECYGASAYKDQKLRGKVALSFAIANDGRISRARVTEAKGDDARRRDASEAMSEVGACLTERLDAMTLTRAKASSKASILVQIGPGDEPMPPPGEKITPGDGAIPPASIQAVMKAAEPRFLKCYEDALGYAPALWGRLGLRFHVTDKGVTDEAFEAETRFPDERVKLCALKVARTLTFPKPKGGDVRFVAALRFWSDKSVIAPPARPAGSEIGALLR